jgi:hypothetical protein
LRSSAPVVASKRYAEPDLVPLSSSNRVPTATIVPSIATESPKSVLFVPSPGMSLNVGVPVAASNRETEPESVPLSSSL